MDHAAEKSGFPPKRLDRQLDLDVLHLNVALPLPERIKLQFKSKPNRNLQLSLPPRPPLSRVKLDFQSERSRITTEVKDGATKEQKRCKCKQSRCIKL
ncbi:hypothetical protein RHGRI_024983 [Rhododendron griersonianum]|uniref:Uncharacterized protein n=1 Tax=Rhododendron griersonianum TaxID=479676 RepID=A0AAV6JE85_9ERIC|nr:hypothetical protein RHGRI_024983 [Rhododendron griersonianum]